MNESLNNKDIVDQFKNILNELDGVNENQVLSVTHLIKEKMMNLGASIYENWFTEKIGNGYKGTKIKDENQKKYRFHDHLKKNS